MLLFYNEYLVFEFFVCFFRIDFQEYNQWIRRYVGFEVFDIVYIVSLFFQKIVQVFSFYQSL